MIEVEQLSGTEVEVKTLDTTQLARVLFSLYGYDLLYEDSFRRSLCKNKTPQERQRIISALFGKVVPNPSEQVAHMMQVKWRVGSERAIRLGRMLGVPEEFLPLQINSVSAVEVSSPVNPLPDLYNYQQEVVDVALARLEGDECPPFILQMPTGSGKTRTMMEVMSQLMLRAATDTSRKVILWLAHTEELCEQAVESIQQIWPHRGNREIVIGRLWGTYKTETKLSQLDFIVAGYARLSSLFKKSPEFMEELGQRVACVVVDEAHRAAAPSIKSILNAMEKQGLPIIGLTATPGRSTEDMLENMELESIFSGGLVRSEILGNKPIRELQSRGILSTCQHQIIDTDSQIHMSNTAGYSEYGDFTSALLNRLSLNTERNTRICDLVESLVQEGRQTILFACSVEHAQRLAIMMSVRGINANSIHCKLRSAVRRSIIDAFKKNEVNVLLNYGVLSTGFDAPNIGAVVIARPTMSIILYSQMIGRGLRGVGVGGNEDCVVVDVRDNLSQYGDLNDIYNYFEGYWGN